MTEIWVEIIPPYADYFLGGQYLFPYELLSTSASIRPFAHYRFVCTTCSRLCCDIPCVLCIHLDILHSQLFKRPFELCTYIQSRSGIVLLDFRVNSGEREGWIHRNTVASKQAESRRQNRNRKAISREKTCIMTLEDSKTIRTLVRWSREVLVQRRSLKASAWRMPRSWSLGPFYDDASYACHL